MKLKELKKRLTKCNREELHDWFLKILNSKKLKDEKLRYYLLEKTMYEHMETLDHAYHYFTYIELEKVIEAKIR